MVHSGSIFPRNKYPEKPHVLTASVAGIGTAWLLGVLEAVHSQVKRKWFPWSSLRSSSITGKGKSCLHDYTSSVSA